jgi:hypothetical protein
MTFYITNLAGSSGSTRHIMRNTTELFLYVTECLNYSTEYEMAPGEIRRP